jgi:hypothetical protein
VQYYGSGSKAVLQDIASASHIGDPSRIASGATITLPKTAGGIKRKD